VSAHESLLKDVPFFQLLDDSERAALAEVLDEARFKAGDKIFEAGDPGDKLYIVRSGAIELSAKDYLGQKIVFGTEKHGAMFGELSLLDEGSRTATAQVVEDAELLVLGRDDLQKFIRRKPDAALDMMTMMGRRMRESTARLHRMSARNVNEEAQKDVSAFQRFCDWIAAFSGSIEFLLIHIGLFALWLGWNFPNWSLAFDPFPYGLLTMVVSLEAIILSVLVLFSQNQQVAKDRVRADIEYEVNVRAELEVTHLHEKLDQLHSALVSRLHKIEERLKKQ
jgi:CRP/FNR family transcriptional regulator, cyclic AMP receptor protein